MSRRLVASSLGVNLSRLSLPSVLRTLCCLIIRKGAKIAELRDFAKVVVHDAESPPFDESERVVEISAAPLERRMRVVQRIVEDLAELSATANLSLLVPTQHFGSVMGHRGETIRAIMQATGADMRQHKAHQDEHGVDYHLRLIVAKGDWRQNVEVVRSVQQAIERSQVRPPEHTLGDAIETRTAWWLPTHVSVPVFGCVSLSVIDVSFVSCVFCFMWFTFSSLSFVSLDSSYLSFSVGFSVPLRLHSALFATARPATVFPPSLLSSCLVFSLLFPSHRQRLAGLIPSSHRCGVRQLHFCDITCTAHGDVSSDSLGGSVKTVCFTASSKRPTGFVLCIAGFWVLFRCFGCFVHDAVDIFLFPRRGIQAKLSSFFGGHVS